MGVWDIHNAVPREFNPLRGQLALKFDGTSIHYAAHNEHNITVPALGTIAFYSPKRTARH